MKRTVMKFVMAAIGVASFALAPSAFASDRHHRIPLPHEVLGIPAPHEVLLGVISNRGYDNGYYQDDYRYSGPRVRYNDGYRYRYDRRHRHHHHHSHHRNEWRNDRHHHDRHDRRDYREDRGGRRNRR